MTVAKHKLDADGESYVTTFTDRFLKEKPRTSTAIYKLLSEFEDALLGKGEEWKIPDLVAQFWKDRVEPDQPLPTGDDLVLLSAFAGWLHDHGARALSKRGLA